LKNNSFVKFYISFGELILLLAAQYFILNFLVGRMDSGSNVYKFSDRLSNNVIPFAIIGILVIFVFSIFVKLCVTIINWVEKRAK